MDLQRLQIEDLAPDQIVLYWNGSTETVCNVGEISPSGWVHLLEAPGMMYQEFLSHWKETPPGISTCPKREEKQARKQNRFGERAGHHQRVLMIKEMVLEISL